MSHTCTELNVQRCCTDGVASLCVRRITEIHAAVGRKLVALGLDGVTPPSGRHITEIYAAVGRKLVALDLDGATPLSGRRITDIHAAVGQKLVASGCRGTTPLLHLWRCVMSTERSATTPSVPHPLENLSGMGPPGALCNISSASPIKINFFIIPE